MPYNDLDSVVLLHSLKGRDLYGDTQVSAKAGQLATVINVFPDNTYEVEFDDDKAESGYGVLYAREADLAPYVKNAV
ncbi:MAG: hypothetical protein HDR50_04755 [Desulfovibrio sp.]|uniref:hypothetical protein n=1 Tax=Desulfovibrio sp. TaxID=885 RepID=UPI001A6AA5EA|nr:hypothetical protein [Desulfovibrio sp.]MBD5416965.1 hypothetical protein [Desulfovibrio sp.]